MYIEKLQLAGNEYRDPVSVTFQKGVFCPETAVLEDIDVAEILTFFFYGKSSGLDYLEDFSGTLHFCENSIHYRINATYDKSALYKITTLAEEKIELEDGMTFGEALFGVDSYVFMSTVSMSVFDNPDIAKILSDLTLPNGQLLGIYDLMNRIREAANATALEDSDESDTDVKVAEFALGADGTEVTDAANSVGGANLTDPLGDTIVIPMQEDDTEDPLEATRVVEEASATAEEEEDPLDDTIKIAPAPDLEIEAAEVNVRKARRDIDLLTSELEELSKRVEIGKMSDLAEKIADYKEKKKAYEEALKKKRLYEDTYRAGTIELPDNDYVNELCFAVEEIKSCEAELKVIHEERESIDPDHNNNKLSNIYIKVEDDGGIEAIREKLKDMKNGKRIYTLSSIFFAIAGVFLILTGAAVSLLPVYKSLFIANTAISVAHVGLLVLTMGIMCLIPALTSVSGMQSIHENILEMFEDYGCEGAKNPEEFMYNLELAVNESEEKKERLEKLRLVEKKVAKCQSRVSEGQRIIREHLTIWDRAFDGRLSYCENAASAIEVAKEFLSEYESFKNETERARAACDEAGYYIMGFEDKVFDEEFDPCLYRMSEEEIKDGERTVDALKEKLNTLYDELDVLKSKRDELVFAQKEIKAQRARPEPDPWLCELIDKLEVIANSENADAWEMAVARAQMIVSKQKNETSETLKAVILILSAFETFYDKVMPPQFILVNSNKEQFSEEIERLKNELVSNQIVIY